MAKQNKTAQIFTVTLLLCLFFLPLSAQRQPGDEFIYYSIEHGMASNNIWDFYEDEAGRLLVATSSGLNIIGNNHIARFDQEDGLPADVVLTLAPWPGKGVLVGTIRGYCLFSNNKVIKFKDSPREIFRDFAVNKDGSVIAVASRKIFFLDSTGSLRDSLVFPDAPQTFRDIYLIDKKSFYLASTDGLFFYRYGKMDTVRQFWQKAFWQIEKFENQIYFVSNKGVWNTLDGKHFRRLFKPPGDQSRSINDIIKIDDDKYWLGTWGEGIFEYRGFEFNRKIGYLEGFPSLYVTRFYRDREGGIFIGSYGSGAIYRRNFKQNKWLISHFPRISEKMISAAGVDNALLFWGLGREVGQIRGKNISFEPLPANIKSHPNEIIYFKKNYYVATADYLFRGKTLKKMKKVGKKARGTAIRFLQSSEADLWLLTTASLVQIFPRFHEYILPQGTYYSTSNKYFIKQRGEDFYVCGEHLPLMRIRQQKISVISKSYDNMYNGMAILEDSTVVIGENDGITHIRNNQLTGEKKLPTEKVQFLMDDNKGGFWTGYQNGDLYHVHREDTLFIPGGELPVIGQIRDAFTSSNYLFLVSRTGVLQYNLFSDNYRFFHINDILRGEVPGEINKAIPTFDSIMLLTNAGIVSFREPFLEEEQKPGLLLYQLEIPTRQQTISFPTPKKGFEINDNDLVVFHFLGLDYRAGKNLFTRVRLLPAQKSFKKFFNKFDFQYARLAPGNYTLQYFNENFNGQRGETRTFSFSIISHSFLRPQNMLVILLLALLSTVAIVYLFNVIIRYRRKLLHTKISQHTGLLHQQVLDMQRDRGKRSEFYRVFSHDLKAPIRNILGLERIIRKKIPQSDEGLENTLNRVRENASKSMDMIDDILELTQTESADFPFEVIELQPFFDQLLHQFKGDISQHNVALQFDLRLKKLIAQRKKLKIICQNLIDNAIKYRSENRQPRIVIRSKKTADFYQIAITDNGRGIPSSQLDNIFTIYRRGENAVSSGVSGRGVGLTAANRLAEDYLGNIEVASEAETGTTFIVSLSRKFLEARKPGN